MWRRWRNPGCRIRPCGTAARRVCRHTSGTVGPRSRRLRSQRLGQRLLSRIECRGSVRRLRGFDVVHGWFLHQRGAHEDFLAILSEYRSALVDACVHCFTDTLEAMQSYVALDCYIGITGWVCDAKRGAALRAIAPLIPDARLMIETDAPYLLPHNVPRGQRPSSLHSDKPGIDGRRNEPAYLPWVAQTLAELRGESLATVVTQTSSNAQRFFRLPG